MSAQKPREIAVRILQQHGRSGCYLETLLEREFANRALSPADRRLCQELVYGVTRWRATLDWLIGRRTAAPPQPARLMDILRLGLYQILWLDRIPDHAAVHETVELAKRLGLSAQAGFVNAILRAYLRELHVTRDLLKELQITAPHLGWSHPEWLVRRWLDRWGPDRTRQLLHWNNTPARNYARINRLKVQPAEVLQRWRNQENVECDVFARDWYEEDLVYELRRHPPLAKMDTFVAGWFYVQDPSTLLAPWSLQVQPGQRVLDACAAPGGKTTYLAQLLGNEGRILALDTDPERLQVLRDNCERLGASCVEVQPADASLPDWARDGFDRVLVDAPCSNTGVMRRRVDLRWRLQGEDLHRLPPRQLQLLRQAASRVRPGGLLVYSTCSLEPEENEQVVRAFMQTVPGFVLEHERILLPFVDGVDGAYVARLRRRS
ncbi:MAG: 16S rRNA (cytosine(967)-C(5))-methyltransferase RsmB [Verrucomicrobiota bacterium]|nr:16S rRNA (cytosine(967)-C(5))-methyltransferase RsmB [Limisphaera sp.]MDW8382050.1 16S rRNA (cytosine(967)-C(5))-methyltransferase RsmB [Verrucomicrobiota bacterium]